MTNPNFLYSELDNIIGEEGFKDVLSSVAQTSLKGAKFLAGKTADTFDKAFSKASKELIVALGSNKAKINQAEKQVKKHQQAVFFTKEIVEKLSSSDYADTLINETASLDDAMKSIKNHVLEIQAFNEKRLSLFKHYTGIKTPGDASTLLNSLEKLTFPKPNFPHKDNVMLVTNILPQGKVFEYNTETHHHSIGSKATESESGDNVLNHDQLQTLLKQIEKINDVYRFIAKANQDYLSQLKKYNTVIKESFEYLENSKDILSVSVKRDLLNRLEGDKNSFSFYTGFLPKVINYVDSFITLLTTYLISKTA